MKKDAVISVRRGRQCDDDVVVDDDDDVWDLW